MSKPSILIVPGSFVLPDVYDDVIAGVKANGYDIRALHLPSVGLGTLQGRPGAPPTMYDDAAFIAKEAEALADEGKDVILVAHSYGGVPLSESVKGLGLKDRQKAGKAGGIVQLAYLTSLVPPVGKAAKDVLADVPDGQKLDLKVDETGWMYHDQPEVTAAIILNSVSLEEGTAQVAKFSKHSGASFVSELTYPGYKDAPVAYLFCENDLCIPPAVQQAGIDLIEKESGRKVAVTSIKADHCPNYTALQETIAWISDVAGKAGRDWE